MCFFHIYAGERKKVNETRYRLRRFAMARLTIFDPTTRVSKTIDSTLETAVIETDPNASIDYFIKLSTSAKKISGAAIAPKIIRELTDLAKGSTQHNGSATPYTSMTAAIEDHILHMIEGNGGSDAMSFT